MTHHTATTGGLFAADPDRCIACGLCADDCPANIIIIDAGLASVPAAEEDECLRCQHCLAVCPTAAVSVAGRRPEDSLSVGGPDFGELDRLMRSRRSVRRFDARPVDRELFDRVLRAAAYAPTGVNARDRRFTAILDPGVMSDLRDRCCQALAAGADRLPENLGWLAGAASKWLEKGRDVIFRSAPHILVVTAGPGATTGVADCLISLSYFELAAQTADIGTVWCGMVEMMLQHLPETRRFFGIPDDHQIGYAILFGRPGIRYPRTVQYEPEAVTILDRLPD